MSSFRFRQNHKTKKGEKILETKKKTQKENKEDEVEKNTKE